jgi:histidinol-phosphatase (PHP family)
MEKYIQRAIELKIDIFGFSCHAPMEFEPEYRMNLAQSKIYEQDVLNLKGKYKNDIQILLAYEVDFMSDNKYLEKSILDAKVDYLIGSVHFVDKWGFDNPEFIGKYEEKDINTIWEEYFEAVSSMVKTNYFNIVGHLDLIKIFKYLPTKDIKTLAMKTMKDIQKSGMVLEINSAGLRKPIKEQYPSIELLTLAYELNIPITFGSDAHTIEQIGFGYEDVVSIAKKIGYKRCMTFKNKIQIPHNF